MYYHSFSMVNWFVLFVPGARDTLYIDEEPNTLVRVILILVIM